MRSLPVLLKTAWYEVIRPWRSLSPRLAHLVNKSSRPGQPHRASPDSSQSNHHILLFVVCTARISAVSRRFDQLEAPTDLMPNSPRSPSTSAVIRPTARSTSTTRRHHPQPLCWFLFLYVKRRRSAASSLTFVERRLSGRRDDTRPGSAGPASPGAMRCGSSAG